MLVRVLVETSCVNLIPDDDATGMAMTRTSILELRRQRRHGGEEAMLMRKEVMMKIVGILKDGYVCRVPLPRTEQLRKLDNVLFLPRPF